MNVQQTSLNVYNKYQRNGRLSQREDQVLTSLMNLHKLGFPNASDQEILLFGMPLKLSQRGDPNIVRPRRRALVLKGLVHQDDVRLCKVTREFVKVWRVVF